MSRKTSNWGAVHSGTCYICGKRLYASKQVARNAARVLYPETHLRAYPACLRGYYHIGNTPTRIKEGKRR